MVDLGGGEMISEDDMNQLLEQAIEQKKEMQMDAMVERGAKVAEEQKS